MASPLLSLTLTDIASVRDGLADDPTAWPGPEGIDVAGIQLIVAARDRVPMLGVRSATLGEVRD